jgi:hypothetical protein
MKPKIYIIIRSPFSITVKSQTYSLVVESFVSPFRPLNSMQCVSELVLSLAVLLFGL